MTRAMSEEQKQVLAIIEAADRPVTAQDIAESLSRKRNGVRNLLVKMERAGLIRVDFVGASSHTGRPSSHWVIRADNRAHRPRPDIAAAWLTAPIH